MNIHLMLILLGFVAPVHKDLPLLEAPQVVAPLSLMEDRLTLKELKALMAKVKEPV
jgi:hypothetical protein